MGDFVTITVAAAVVTKLVDMVRNFVDKDDSLPKYLWNVLAFALGVVGAFAFQIEPAQVPEGLRFEITGGALQLFTGLVVGAWASGLHELLDFLSHKAKT